MEVKLINSRVKTSKVKEEIALYEKFLHLPPGYQNLAAAKASDIGFWRGEKDRKEKCLFMETYGKSL